MFYPKNTCLPFLLPTKAVDTDECFVDVMGCKNTKYNVQKNMAVWFTVEHQLFTLVFALIDLSLFCSSINISVLTHITLFIFHFFKIQFIFKLFHVYDFYMFRIFIFPQNKINILNSLLNQMKVSSVKTLFINVIAYTNGFLSLLNILILVFSSLAFD